MCVRLSLRVRFHLPPCLAYGILDGPYRQVEELETSLDLPLQLVYMKQLTLLREKALQRYKTLSKGSETSDYQVRSQRPVTVERFVLLQVPPWAKT